MDVDVQTNPLSKREFLFLGLLACYIFGQALFPDLERKYFWGEGMAFLLFFVCFQTSYAHKFQKKILLGIYLWIFALSIYGLFLSFFLIKQDAHPYHLIRHLAFFYYALFFFAGYKWGPFMIQKLSRYWLPLSLFILFVTFSFGGGLGSLMLFGLLWLICQKGNSKKFIFYLMLTGMAVMWGGSPNSTAKVIGLVFACSPIFIYFLKIWNQTKYARINQFFIRFLLLVMSIFLIYGANQLMDLIYRVAAAGGTFHAFFDDFYFTDMNGVWRILFWTYLFNQFLENPFGIGLGTPLVTFELSDFMYLIQKEGDEYTSGAHNSFLTFLVRLGVPYAILFIYMCFYSGKLVLHFLSKTNYIVFDTPQNRFVFAVILVFLIGVIQSCFNVVLESPISSGLFWFNFGIFVRVVGDFLAQERPIHETP